LALKTDDQYQSSFALALLPSAMSLTMEKMEMCFSHRFVDVPIKKLIADIVNFLHRIGMDSAQSFFPVEATAWKPVHFNSLGDLARNLDDTSHHVVSNEETLDILC